MDDDEFKRNVMQGFQSLEAAIADVRSDTESNVEHLDKRLDAVVARLDEQDAAADRIMQKLDRLTTQVALAAEASEQALDSITHLSRRVAKLEHPDDGRPSGAA